LPSSPQCSCLRSLRAKAKAQQTACINNLKQTGIAYTMYRMDNNDVNCPQRQCPDTPNDPYGLSFRFQAAPRLAPAADRPE